MALLRCVFLAIVALSDARSFPPTRPPASGALAKTLSLRGGAAAPPLIAASPAAPATRSKKATVALGLNAGVSVAYGILATCNPNAMLAIYGVTGALDFMSPAFGVCQYLGGMHIAVALRCLATIGVPGLPKRDAKETLEGMTALHTVAGCIAAFRQFKGSSSPVVGSVLMAGLSYWASKD